MRKFCYRKVFMGLDQYGYHFDASAVGNKQTFEYNELEYKKEFFYWRKHANLEGWMRELYKQKGGQNPVFNGCFVRLEEEDLMRLKSAVINRELPETTGFFFGTSTEDDYTATLNFIEKSLTLMQQGKAIFYFSDW